MSKTYEKYLKLKRNNEKIIYLFKSGIFYIALAEDAIFLNKKFEFKLSNFNNEIKKCGFPVKSIKKYQEMFKENKIKYEIVKESDKDSIIKILEKVDINNLTPLEALNIIGRLKEKLWIKNLKSPLFTIDI